MEKTTWCSHGKTNHQYCADCRVSYLEKIVKEQNEHIKELEQEVKQFKVTK